MYARITHSLALIGLASFLTITSARCFYSSLVANSLIRDMAKTQADEICKKFEGDFEIGQEKKHAS